MWQRGRGISFQAAASSSGGRGSLGSVPTPMLLAEQGPRLSRAERLAAAAEIREKEQQYFSLSAHQYAGGSTTSRPAIIPSSMPTSSSRGADYTTYGIGRKRHVDGDEQYWDKDDDDQLEYQPAPDSPTGKEEEEKEDDFEEDDPLDAFMAGVEVQAKKDKAAAIKREEEGPKIEKKEKDAKKKPTLGRADIEEEDMQESYFNWLEENKNKQQDDDEEELVEYDAEGNPIFTKKMIDPLPPVDHSQIEYQPFWRNFYHEHADITALNNQQVHDLRQTLGIKVSGLHPPKPVSSFAHFNFDNQLMNVIRKSEYTQPTPIQAQGIPAAMLGRDIIGIAKTGSGKTVAYLWPALVHIMDQREIAEGEGPIVLILVPTRELAIQVYNEAKRFGKVYDIHTVCAYGGGSKWEQTKALADGCEIIVATPGRLIDLIKVGATNLKRATYLVLDEADRMFDLGFEPQVRSIANHVRPDRQCMLFSATFKKRVERLARDCLSDPVRVVQGEVGEANADVIQTVELMHTPVQKWEWLLKRMVEFGTKGKILIFVTKKQNCEELATSLKAKDFQIGLLHGDCHQQERNDVLKRFRGRDLHILVATDVAARGLDIPEIRTVVNYDIARDIDTHVHRIGRTGRAGEKGWAYTLLTDKDREFAGHLVRNLESVGQEVPPALMNLAMQSAWFKSSRWKNRSRPGLGADTSSGPAALAPRKRRLGLGANKDTPDFGGSATSAVPASGAVTLREALDKAKASGVTDRLSVMKTAFSMSYKNKFTAAAEPEPQFKASSPQSSDSTSATRKKRSRWEDTS